MATSSVLLSSQSRVEIPYIKVTIGDYTFGVFQKQAINKTAAGFYQQVGVTYPNYIQSLDVKKVNGAVNTYTLQFVYPIRSGDDPNFFERVFSKTSKTRKIVFSYGDMSNPDYIYKNEEAIITKVKPSFSTSSALITYTVTATSSCVLTQSGSYNFPATRVKPSDMIKKLLYNTTYKLTKLFYGMVDKELVEALGLIATNDAVVDAEAKYNISVFDYIKYLVSLMHNASENNSSKIYSSCYQFTIHDNINSDPNASLTGPYFKVTEVSKNKNMPEAYTINFGWPDNLLVKNISFSDNDTFSLLYNWQGELSANDYVNRLNPDGDWERVFCPTVSSKNECFETQPDDQVWWSTMTAFPVSCTIQLRGLILPAELMSYVRLNMIYFGRKQAYSGLYIITSQEDSISASGYTTTLTMTRIASDDGEEIIK